MIIWSPDPTIHDATTLESYNNFQLIGGGGGRPNRALACASSHYQMQVAVLEQSAALQYNIQEQLPKIVH